MNKIAGMIARSVAEARAARPNPLIPVPVNPNEADCHHCGGRIHKAKFTGAGWNAPHHLATGLMECNPEDPETTKAERIEEATCPRRGHRQMHEAHENAGGECVGFTLAQEQRYIRGYVFNFFGKDDRRASIVYDRYGRNADQFMKHRRAELTSIALGSIMADPAFGPDWLERYTVTVVPAI